MEYKTMHAYYAKADFLPTYARLKTQADLDAHAAARATFLNDKLYLPARLFYHADLIEFGPDCGENALAFAQWRAYCTLVEPNLKAHPIIREYFKRYNLDQQVFQILGQDIATYAQGTIRRAYDFVIAEGFIYTVKPTVLWVDLFSRLLKPGGFALISYYERYGGYIELFTKKIHKRVMELTGKDSLTVAHLLFDAKWALIPHQRTFNQWVADVLDDPFVCEENFLEAEALCQEFERAGMRLYSSWPQYRSPEHYWHKLPEPQGSRERFIEVQRYNWKYGGKNTPENEKNRSLLEGIEHLLRIGDVNGIVQTCQGNQDWLKLYGMPNQFAAFQKL